MDSGKVVIGFIDETLLKVVKVTDNLKTLTQHML